MIDPLTEYGISSENKTFMSLTEYVRKLEEGAIFSSFHCLANEFSVSGNDLLFRDVIIGSLTDGETLGAIARMAHVPELYAQRIPDELRDACLMNGLKEAGGTGYTAEFTGNVLKHLIPDGTMLMTRVNGLKMLDKGTNGRLLIWDVLDTSYYQQIDLVYRGLYTKQDDMTWMSGVRLYFKYRRHAPELYPIVCCVDTSAVLQCPGLDVFDGRGNAECLRKKYGEWVENIYKERKPLLHRVDRAANVKIDNVPQYFDKYSKVTGVTGRPVKRLASLLKQCEGDFTRLECIRIAATAALNPRTTLPMHYQYESLAGAMLLNTTQKKGIRIGCSQM